MKILDFVICDDVRMEVGNKNSIMGAYNDLIVLQAKSKSDLKFPLAFRLGFYLRIDLEGHKEDIGSIDFTFKGDILDSFEGSFGFQKINDFNRPLVLFASGFFLNVKGFGSMDISFLVKDKEGKEICTLKPALNFGVQFQEVKVAQ